LWWLRVHLGLLPLPLPLLWRCRLCLFWHFHSF
jgi:hypothetical protein